MYTPYGRWEKGGQGMEGGERGGSLGYPDQGRRGRKELREGGREGGRKELREGGREEGREGEGGKERRLKAIMITQHVYTMYIVYTGTVCKCNN